MCSIIGINGVEGLKKEDVIISILNAAERASKMIKKENSTVCDNCQIKIWRQLKSR